MSERFPNPLAIDPLQTALTAETIATPTGLFVCAASDQAADVEEQMRQTQLDVLPVDDRVSAFWVHPRAYPHCTRSVPFLQPIGAEDLVAADTPILSLLHLMVQRERGFYFVLREADVGGIVTYADFNKLLVRAAVFTCVSQVEEALIQMLEAALAGGDAWRDWLGPKDVSVIEKFWRPARASGVDLHPIRYASLTQLIRLCAASPTVAPRLVETVGSNWAADMEHLRDYARNPVAHAGKLLVRSLADLAYLDKACRFAAEFERRRPLCNG